MEKEKKVIDWKYNLKEYWGALKRYKLMLFFLLILIVVIEIMHVVPNFLFKEFVDKGTLFFEGSLGLEEFKFVLLIILGVYLLSGFIEIIGGWFRNFFTARIETKMMSYLKMKYFRHIVSLDHEFHSTHKTGSLISRMNRGVRSIERISDTILFNFIGPFVQLIIIGFSIAYFDLVAAFVILGIIISFILYSYFYQKRQVKLRTISNDADNIEKGNISDIFTNIDSVRYFGKEKQISNIFRKLVKNAEFADYNLWVSYGWLTAGQIFIVIIGTSILLTFPILRFLSGALTLGEVVFIYSIYRNLFGPIWNFVGGMQGFQRAMIDFQDLFSYGKIKSKIKDKSGARTSGIKSGKIEFRDVDFGYKGKKVFKDFNLKIENKKKIALVGHSGCGKSTLISLLYRFYDIDKGNVLVDGLDVKDYAQEVLRSSMSIVPQECVLFDDTIWNNIKFSNPRATRDEVLRAIKFAQLDKIIRDMPKKEKTIVGERGVRLSGGEKQRVSIARAILANKKILVLDEATSALDSETEFEIQNALGKLMKGRTSIIIAHRLSTIMHADNIIVMKRGRIIERGRHGELLRRRGEYYRLWKLQRGGYIQ